MPWSEQTVMSQCQGQGQGRWSWAPVPGGAPTPWQETPVCVASSRALQVKPQSRWMAEPRTHSSGQATQVSRQLFAAVLVPIIYFGTLLVAGLLHPGYSHVSQLPSELGAVGAPYAWVFNGGLIATGLALLVATPGIPMAR